MGEDEGQGHLQIFLMGPFRLISADGQEIVLRAAKARGLIALLAVSPVFRRSRIWLQDKLWSDRGREQASASLRQALSQLRDELGALDCVLQASRDDIWLNPSRIKVFDKVQGTDQAEFLEGLDLRDPEFEAWLRTERMARLPAVAQSTKTIAAPPQTRAGKARPVYIVAQGAPRSTERLYEDIFVDCLECSLRESLTVDVYRRDPPAIEIDPLIMAVQAFAVSGQGHGLRVHIEEGRRRRTLWTGMRIVPASGAPPVEHKDVLALAYEATEALADAQLLDRLRSREQLDSSLMARMAIRKIFMLTPDELERADLLLDQAFEIDAHPQFLAWRIQLRVIQQLERHPQGQSASHELPKLIADALALDPTNSMVLAATANAKLLIDGDVVAGVEIARASLRMNASNPFAWDCLSIALLMNGAAEEAHRHQMWANQIAARYPIRHFRDMGAALTSVVTNRHEDALKLAQTAHAMAQSFRPPLRYLTALNGANGQHEAAITYAARLRELEPDFSFERLLSDSAYPVAALRRSGLLTSGALRELRHHSL